MDELKENLKNIDIEELYNTYLTLTTLIEELNKNIKQLPPKEEL